MECDEFWGRHHCSIYRQSIKTTNVIKNTLREVIVLSRDEISYRYTAGTSQSERFYTLDSCEGALAERGWLAHNVEKNAKMSRVFLPFPSAACSGLSLDVTVVVTLHCSLSSSVVLKPENET